MSRRRSDPAVIKREKHCTCPKEIVKANMVPVNGRYVGHSASCPLHWKIAS